MVSLFKRFAALFYDCLCVIGLCFLVTGLWVWLWDNPATWWEKLALRLGLLLTIFGYTGYCWVHQGQTLGLKAWRLKLVHNNGNPLRWPHALKRFCAAGLSIVCFGAGYWCAFFHRDKLTWTDSLSHTRLINVSVASPGPQ